MSNKYSCNCGISTCGDERVSYIYICGIMPVRSIYIEKNITLQPVKSSANPLEMISCFMDLEKIDMVRNISEHGNDREFQMGILISTLRTVQAQLEITASNVRELATSTWNARHIDLQISALLNCETASYFQANTSADKFNAKTRLNMIQPNMYRCPMDTIIINEKECDFLEHHLPIALKLEEDERYANTSNALWCHNIQFRPSVKLSILWGGIESLFLIERGIKKKLSMAISRFLYGNDSQVKRIQDLYGYRCKAVHEMENAERNILKESASLLHALILQCVKIQSVPDVSKLLGN